MILISYKILGIEEIKGYYSNIQGSDSDSDNLEKKGDENKDKEYVNQGIKRMNGFEKVVDGGSDSKPPSSNLIGTG